MNKILALRIERDEDGDFEVTHESLPVLGFGATLSEALADFAEMFEVQWEGLVECDPRDLSPAALRARADMLDYGARSTG